MKSSRANPPRAAAGAERRPRSCDGVRAVPARTLALAGLLLAACGRTAGPSAADVLLITVDTLRADHVGFGGYGRATTPRLDAFFEGGAVFTRCYSTEASTSPSVVSLLSGLHPQDHGVRLFNQLVDEDVRLLPDRLPAEYQTAAFVSNTVLCDESLGIAARFDHYDDFVDQRESVRVVYERDAARTTEAALRWLAVERDPARPLFLWVHYIDPHGPYRPPKTWGVVFDDPEVRPIPPDRIPRHIREGRLRDGNAYVDRYDSEIAFTDREIGRLLDGCARHVDLDRALVVMTADHGESMMEHERWFTHGYQVYDEIVRVPLVLRGPGVVPGRFDALTSGVDVAVTILGFAGGDTTGLAGWDLRRPREIPADRIVFSEAGDRHGQWRAAVQGGRKWVVRLAGDDGAAIVSRGSYDLSRDPGEAAPQEDGPTELLARLLERIALDPDPAGVPREYRQGMPLRAPKAAPGLSPEALERLEALGYTE